MADNDVSQSSIKDSNKQMSNIPGNTRPERLPGSPVDSRRLIVGRDICLSGAITACDTLVVEGRVEAALQESHRMEIAESGYFKGNVDIAVAEIKGEFEGELIARERLIIRKTGRVTGKITYTEIEIERGGKLSGNIKLISANESKNKTNLVPSDATS
ncbi:MAG: polymer-forming cytoskeletal protein [Pseudomonadota bacterium]|nr:polymer-forming cytoskeletal protein [Pseudomonadota bacterium]|tara:strand:+ start:289 stop:762 length:474 start_codon:yes stop_codon:yes gene_type:complete